MMFKTFVNNDVMSGGIEDFRKVCLAVVAVAVAFACGAQHGRPLYVSGLGDFTGGYFNYVNPDEFLYEEGVYKLHVDNLARIVISTGKSTSDDPFAFDRNTLWCGESDYGGKPGVTVPLMTKPYTKYILCPWPGDYDVTVAGDLSTIIMETDTPQPFLPEDLYIFDCSVGEFRPEWRLTRLVKEEGIYTFTCGEDQQISEGESFIIYGYDPFTNVGGSGELVMLDSETPVWRNTNQTLLKMGEDWNGVLWLKIEYDWCNGTLILSNNKDFVPSWYSGTVNVGLEKDGEAVFYNLQGVRVASPSGGVFIKVGDGKVSKVAM